MNRIWNSIQRTWVVLAAATLYLSLSGFECASTEMTTARVALKRKDFAAAETSLNKEVTQHPQNGEAWKLLGDVFYEQAKYAEMDKAFTSAVAATTPPLKDDDKKDIAIKRYNAWSLVYQRAVDAYNNGISENNKKFYQVALAHIDTAMMLRPSYTENIFIRATLLGALERVNELNSAYKEYIDAINADVETGTSAGLALGLSPEQVEAKLGKSTRQDIKDSVGGYSYYEPKNLYVYYVFDDKSGKQEVQGWRYFAEPVPAFIAQSSTPLRSSPYYVLGVDAYQEGKDNKARYNDALKYLQLVQKLDPQRPNIGELISEIYVNSGRTAEAKSLLEQRIRENPKDATAYIALGNLLFQAKDYYKSAEAFKKVTEIGLKNDDPNLGVALFNLGAVYKNIGADLQDSIRRVTSVPTAAQIDAYRKPLRESARYFEQRKAVGSQNDFNLLAELGNLYDVLGEKDKVQQTLKELEMMQSDSKVKSDPQYWRAMSRFYAIVGDAKNAEMADKKASELNR